MREFLLGVAALPLCSCAASTTHAALAASAATSGADSCGAASYAHLVGSYVEDARKINRDYRVVSGRASVDSPGRLTVVYDANDRRITDILCG
jgi:hypothetical protein